MILGVSIMYLKIGKIVNSLGGKKNIKMCMKIINAMIEYLSFSTKLTVHKEF